MGSAQLITDNEGREYERIEYTPYGEYRIEKIYSDSTLLGIFSTSFAAQNSVSNRKVAAFTGKERDEARTIAGVSCVGLYYYEARYMDPRTSRWLSTDPALGDYMAGSKAGVGGIYNQVNFNLYHHMKKLISILFLIFSSFCIFGENINLCFNAEINKYYSKFNRKNKLSEKNIILNFNENGLLTGLTNGFDKLSGYYGNNLVIKQSNDKIQVYYDDRLLLIFQNDNENLTVTKLFNKKTETSKIIFLENEIYWDSRKIEMMTNKILEKKNDIIFLHYSNALLETFFKETKSRMYKYESKADAVIISCFKIGPGNDWDLMFENNNVRCSGTFNFKNKKNNFISYYILRTYNEILSDIYLGLIGFTFEELK